MEKDAARHAVSMDQVLMSGRKASSDVGAPVTRDVTSLHPSGDELPLPAGIQAQQHRLATSLRRRHKLPPLPPLPPLLKAWENAAASQSPSSAQPLMQAEVPPVVEINAVRRASARTVLPVDPLFTWKQLAAEAVGERQDELVLDRSLIAKAGAVSPTDADWNSLKVRLRAVVEEWVEHQRLDHDGNHGS